MRSSNPRLGEVVALAADQIDDQGRQWIEVMPTATEARNGPWFFTITAEDLQAYAEYIKANPERIPVDYDHADEGSTVAAGWFTGDAEVRTIEGAPRLFAEVEWTPQALEELKAKRYRFISPEWSMAEKDKKTGLMTKAKAIVAATLTNRPFFKELAPVASDVVWAPEQGYENLRQKINSVINPGPIDTARFWVMDITDGKALVCEYGPEDKNWVVPFTIESTGDVTVAPSSDWIEAEKEWVSAAKQAEVANRSRLPFNPTGKEREMETTALAEKLGLPADATEEQILQSIGETREKAEKAVEQTGTVPAALIASAAKGEQAHLELHEMKREALLTDAIAKGKILPVQKDSFVAMYDANPAVTAKLIEDTPERKVVAVGAGGSEDEGEQAETEKLTAIAKNFSDSSAQALVEDETLIMHAKAVEALTAAGRILYTADEYTTALAAEYDKATRARLGSAIAA